jgi:DNA repair protein RecN (Recombination protein N)
MLRELQVRDLALVEHARVTFGAGLNLLTGETGSGKSLIVDALGLALGARASAEQVRRGAERARIEAVFELQGETATAVRHQGLGSGRLVLGREIGGRGAARINGRPATPGQLREIGRFLAGIHGQHDQRLLLDGEAQTLLLDGFAGTLELREAVAAAHRVWSEAGSKLASLERMQARGKREEEYLRWQLEELCRAGLRPGEDAELAAERQVVRHAARLAELIGAALSALQADERVAAAGTTVRAAAELDPRLGEAASRLAAVDEELADLAAELRRYLDAIDADPQRLEAIESRLAVLEQVKRKYGGSLEEAIAERQRLEAQLAQAEDLEAALETARVEQVRAREELEHLAAKLSEVRGAAARRLEEAVTAELAGLCLDEATFEVGLVPRPDVGPEGAETVEMRLSANPGEPPAQLSRVASGGELSRVMLAIRAAGAEADQLPTLVFDEVDTGIGGETAVQVGLRLRALGSRRQVLVVSHLAQIACFADHHLVVEKVPGPAGRSVVRVRELVSEEERAVELARMMSGAATDKALARARELLEEARFAVGRPSPPAMAATG